LRNCRRFRVQSFSTLAVLALFDLTQLPSHLSENETTGLSYISYGQLDLVENRSAAAEKDLQAGGRTVQ
jgi:hypothetical protein